MPDLDSTLRRIRESVGYVLIDFGDGEPLKTGTAFLIDRDGLSVTCSHVVDFPRLNRVLVKFPSMSEPIPAEIVYRESEPYRTDVAVLKCDGDAFPYLRLGNYDGTSEGQEIAFSGYPLKINRLSTFVGIISVKGRLDEITGSTRNIPHVDGFQLSAMVNPGNSGGPLYLPSSGAVVGFIDAKYDPLGTAIQDIRNIPEGNVVVDGISVVRAIKAIFETMRDSSQVGIGYAVSVGYVNQVLRESNTVINR